MNHSDDPSLGYDKEKDTHGEELTVIYNEFCDQSEDSTCATCGICSK